MYLCIPRRYRSRFATRTVFSLALFLIVAASIVRRGAWPLPPVFLQRESNVAVVVSPSKTFESRARGALLGNLIGDAAATPNHWVYDPEKLATHVASAKRGPAFCDPPGSPFYRTEPGALSCYGDQTMCLLESLVACKGFDAADYAIRLQVCFGANSKYE